MQPVLVTANLPKAAASWRVAELALCLAAAGGAISLGAVNYWGFLPMITAAVIIAVVVFWQSELPQLSALAWVMLAVLVLFPLFQLVPLPSSLLGLLSPKHTAIRQILAPLGISSSNLAVTFNPIATVIAVLKLIAYVCVFLVGYKRYSESRRTSLVLFLIVFGAAEAVYGMLQYWLKWEYILGFAMRFSTNVASGTYIDRNNYAGLLSMVAPFVLAGIVADIESWWRRGGRADDFFGRTSDSGGMGKVVVQIVLLTVVFLALVFSHSRMGIASTLVALVAVLFSMTRSRSQASWAVLILAVPLAYAIWAGIDTVLARFQVINTPGYFTTEELRPKVWRDTAGMIRDFPLLGVGLGAVSFVYPRYQQEMLPWGTVDHVHNDYLQFAAELGIPLALVLFGSLWFIAIRSLVYSRRVEGRHRVVAAGCGGALLAILLHSITEFNLQIPANALIFAWIAGVACAVPALNAEDDRPHHR